ncbi:MAG: fibronectin type III domain-containing protein, partial [Lachnospiraceae bacterium]|nr:fibronectin type III domain-containing protein [Lachnospiraceae bacterium]
HKPEVTVTADDQTVKTSDYEVTYENNREIGKATVTVTGKKNFKGYSGSTSFKILPKRPAIKKKESRNSGEIKISWKKDKQATRYEIQICENRDFKGKVKKMYVTGDETSAVINKLSSGKKYHIRIRSRVKVDGKYWNSKWSIDQSVKVK